MIENIIPDLLEIGDPTIEFYTELFEFFERLVKKSASRMWRDLCSLG